MSQHSERTFIVRVEEIASNRSEMGYAGWSAFGLVMTGLGAGWIALFSSLGLLVMLGAAWVALSLLMTLAGLREARETRRLRKRR
jgi:hypothetical protein